MIRRDYLKKPVCCGIELDDLFDTCTQCGERFSENYATMDEIPIGDRRTGRRYKPEERVEMLEELIRSRM